MIILYPFYFIACWVFTGLTYVLAPILSLMADAEGNLPHWLRWFQTFDASLDEGRNPPYNFTGSDWWVRTRWLWRNPGYTFDLEVLGVRFIPTQWVVVKWDGDIFYARTACGAFCYERSKPFRVKLGWKAWNHFDPETGQFIPGNWARFPKIPIACTP